MTAPAQPIAATLPAPPTAVPAAPAPPTNVVPPPASPLIVIDGTRVPVIPQYVSAPYGGLGALTALSVPAANAAGTGSGLGLLTVGTTSAQPVNMGLNGLGSTAMQIVIGPGGAAAVPAAFGGTGQLIVSDAALQGLGQLSAAVTPSSGNWPSFFGTGVASATLSNIAAFSGLGTITGPYSQTVGLSESVAGNGAATATVAVNGSAVVSAGFGSTGRPQSQTSPAAPVAAPLTGSGTPTSVTGSPARAGSTGALIAQVGVFASFGSTGTDNATLVFPAAYTASGTLSMTAAVTEVAAFSGSGALVGPNTSGMGSGTGVLSMATGGSALFGTTGSASAAIGGPVLWTGTGTLSAAVQPGFQKSGMTKSGTQATPSTSQSWAQIASWSPDTTNYPGSTVTSNALISQGAKATATVSASVAWTPGSFGNSIQVRLKQNGNLLLAGQVTTTSPSTVTAPSVAIASGDQITVEVCDTAPFVYATATITAGTNTYVHIS